MSATLPQVLKVRALSYARLRDRLALHDDSGGITRPSRQLVDQAARTRGLLSQDIVDILRAGGPATGDALDTMTGIPVDDLLADLVAAGTVTVTGDRYGATR